MVIFNMAINSKFLIFLEFYFKMLQFPECRLHKLMYTAVKRYDRLKRFQAYLRKALLSLEAISNLPQIKRYGRLKRC